MGRLFSLILVVSILAPFFAAAQQVDLDRRERVTALLSGQGSPVIHFVCRAQSEDCDDQGE